MKGSYRKPDKRYWFYVGKFRVTGKYVGGRTYTHVPVGPPQSLKKKAASLEKKGYDTRAHLNRRIPVWELYRSRKKSRRKK